MSTLDDDSNERSDDGESLWEAHPFTWILVPLAVLVCCALVITCMRFKRQNREGLLYIRTRNERDLEAHGPGRAIREPNGRWQWTSDAPHMSTGQRRDDLGLGACSRPEGLNELGEAPPAYTPGQKKSAASEDLEMNDMAQSRAQTNYPYTNSQQQTNSQTGPVATPAIANPPAYDNASQGGPVPPPVAVLGTR